MGIRDIPRRCGWPLVLAVSTAVGFGLFALTVAIVRRDRVALPGAITAALVYALLGTLALLGHAWARWVLFTLVTLTALTCALFAFFDLSGARAEIVFTPTLAVVALVAALVATGVAAPLPRR